MFNDHEIYGKKVEFMRSLVNDTGSKLFTEEDALNLITCPDLDKAIQRALQPGHNWDDQPCECQEVTAQYNPGKDKVIITGKCPKRVITINPSEE